MKLFIYHYQAFQFRAGYAVKQCMKSLVPKRYKRHIHNFWVNFKLWLHFSRIHKNGFIAFWNQTQNKQKIMFLAVYDSGLWSIFFLFRMEVPPWNNFTLMTGNHDNPKLHCHFLSAVSVCTCNHLSLLSRRCSSSHGIFAVPFSGKSTSYPAIYHAHHPTDRLHLKRPCAEVDSSHFQSSLISVARAEIGFSVLSRFSCIFLTY
jgi:hypothetical protein